MENFVLGKPYSRTAPGSISYENDHLAGEEHVQRTRSWARGYLAEIEYKIPAARFLSALMMYGPANCRHAVVVSGLASGEVSVDVEVDHIWNLRQTATAPEAKFSATIPRSRREYSHPKIFILSFFSPYGCRRISTDKLSAAGRFSRVECNLWPS